MIKTDVVIIGGGATGCGIARDLTLRGIHHYLVEKGDFANGATGACHGLLHSGARYVVNDPEAAKECIAENTILRRIARKCVEKTGGLFVRLPGDSKRFRDTFLKNCEEVGIPTEVLSPSRALDLVENLNPEMEEAIKVPDCSIDPFRLCMLNAFSSRHRGGGVLIHHKVIDIIREKGMCVGIKAQDRFTSQVKEIRAKIIINATGAWGDQIAQLAGSEAPMTLSKGSLIISNHRLTNMVINRLRPPSDGDIIVPNEAVCLAGTTSIPVTDPDTIEVDPHEVDIVASQAEQMIPKFGSTRLIRAYTGVRPLLKASGGDGRSISRGFQIIDHGNNMFSILGGKLSTYRLMAEKMVDAITEKFGINEPCTTAETPLEGQEELSGYPLSKRLKEMDNIVCECELVTREDVERAINSIGTQHIGDIQHRTRLGMGPCQGGFCTYRALGIMQEIGRVSPEESLKILQAFLQRRFRGIKPALWGDQLREEQMVESIYLGILNMGQPL
ncbi:MAG TPA: anaerobic glycerol-3-phosphate dehydrogenase subunit A [Deltaproteobacteria bacterium]|nr:anaerobic glycerol-3-phosphate dehydrogenase subunit A [Deltaproteobacteria bacterium]HPJ94060.1 anaerobic glycerol-3-phosphate dehydrogenase subunit A [Deltaproteobacteria bacterium]